MFEVKKEVIQSVLNYLTQKPFGEVYKLVFSLQNLKEIKNETSKMPEVPSANKREPASKVQK